MLAWRGVDVAEVADELARREGTSGLVEKASRPQNDRERLKRETSDSEISEPESE